MSEEESECDAVEITARGSPGKQLVLFESTRGRKIQYAIIETSVSDLGDNTFEPDACIGNWAYWLEEPSKTVAMVNFTYASLYFEGAWVVPPPWLWDYHKHIICSFLETTDSQLNDGTLTTVIVFDGQVTLEEETGVAIRFKVIETKATEFSDNTLTTVIVVDAFVTLEDDGEKSPYAFIETIDSDLGDGTLTDIYSSDDRLVLVEDEPPKQFEVLETTYSDLGDGTITDLVIDPANGLVRMAQPEVDQAAITESESSDFSDNTFTETDEDAGIVFMDLADDEPIKTGLLETFRAELDDGSLDGVLVCPNKVKLTDENHNY